MRRLVKSQASIQISTHEADMRRLAADLGYRMERHRSPVGRWYLVSRHGNPSAFAASDLTLDEVGAYLSSHSSLAR